MNIAFDISPLKSEHRFRGVGFYTKNLIKSLEKVDVKNKYYKFGLPTDLPLDIDLIHYPFFDLFKNTLDVKKNTRTIVTVHDLTPLVFPREFPVGLRGKINWLLQKRQLNRVDAVITDSFSSKKDIAKIAGIPPKKIHVIYLAPSTEFRKLPEKKIHRLAINIRKKYKISREFILYVGDVNWNKNVLGIIEVYNQIHRLYSDLDLVLVGKAFQEKNLKESKEIENKITSLKLNSRIIKSGFIPDSDLAVLYNLAKAYIQPSFYEGFGLPVLEAMSCGTPVVCSDAGSLPEVVGGTGVIVNPRNTDEIVKSIGKILKMNRGEIMKIRNKEIEHAKRFSWDKTARETIQVYEKVYKKAI